MSGFISVHELRAKLRSNRTGAVSKPPVYHVRAGEPKALGDGTRSVRFCFSDGSVDRMGDRVSPDGWDLDDFRKNPVALFAHDSNSPPIGKARDVRVEGDRLMGTIEFADAETYGFADTIFRLVTNGFMKAVSVGFLPIKYKFANDPERPFGIDFLSQSLLEISVCCVPALPSALIDARSRGIDTRPLVRWAERALDGGRTTVPRFELEQLRRSARETSTARRRKPGRRADGINEDRPADGGAVVGNCGRPTDRECGLKDPAECAVHNADALEKAAICAAVRSRVEKMLADREDRLRTTEGRCADLAAIRKRLGVVSPAVRVALAAHQLRRL